MLVITRRRSCPRHGFTQRVKCCSVSKKARQKIDERERQRASDFRLVSVDDVLEKAFSVLLVPPEYFFFFAAVANSSILLSVGSPLATNSLSLDRSISCFSLSLFPLDC
jgi:hypothetical protein